jgi:hypothetical protein
VDEIISKSILEVHPSGKSIEVESVLSMAKKSKQLLLNTRLKRESNPRLGTATISPTGDNSCIADLPLSLLGTGQC